MNTIKEIKDNIVSFRYNPVNIQRNSLELLEAVTGGKMDIVDPSNPFVFLLEASAINASATMMHQEALTRKQYPSMAVTEEELYLHMSDTDYLSRFTTPSRTTFSVLLEKEELKVKAVDSGVKGIRKITIPRNTEFTISGYSFTMQYPIDIRVMDYGGIQVVYDNKELSPLVTLEDNIADWELVKINQLEYIKINIPVNQFKIDTRYNQVSSTAPFSIEYKLEDKFYYCRVYQTKDDITWKELRTTHTDQVFDPITPTAVLTVFQNRLKVVIPQVYIDNGLLTGTIRMDIYTSKGDVNLHLDSFQVNAFTARWLDRNLGTGVDKYTLPLTNFSGLGVYSDNVVGGGYDGITFDTLRERVLTNSLGDSQIPITDLQLSARLSNRGYDSIKDIDNVTDRVYLATKKLPLPNSRETVSAAGCTMGTLQTSFKDLENIPGVIDNDTRVTITPSTLFKISDGVVGLVGPEEHDTLNVLDTLSKIEKVNVEGYLYTPFHYVLDTTAKYFTSQVYYLDSPVGLNKEFVEENIGLGLYISTDTFSIRKEERGYVIQVTTKSGDLIKELDDFRISPVLTYKPDDQRTEVYLEGVLLLVEETGERVYEFFIDTSFDIDNEDYLLLNNFKMYDNDFLNYKVQLNATFDLLYYIKGVSSDSQSIRFNPNVYFLTNDDLAVVHEKLTVSFGDRLNDFWTSERSILGSDIYRTWDEDQLAYYTEPVFERDPISGSIILTENSNGKLEYNTLHSVGDPILDEDGVQLIKFTKGSTVLDSEGNPIIDNVKSIVREASIFLVDAKYLFSTYSTDIEYLKELPSTIVGWLKSDIAEFSNFMIEQTNLKFHPQRTIGKANCLILNTEEVYLNLGQSFTVTFYLAEAKFNDTFLRNTLKDISIKVINSELSKDKIKINDISSKLTASVGDDVIALKVDGLGGERDLTVLSIIDSTNRCSINKKLIQDLDGTIKVIDDVEVLFIRHTD